MTWQEQDTYLRHLGTRLKQYGFTEGGTGTYLPTGERDYSYKRRGAPSRAAFISATVKTAYLSTASGTWEGPTSQLIRRVASLPRKRRPVR